MSRHQMSVPNDIYEWAWDIAHLTEGTPRECTVWDVLEELLIHGYEQKASEVDRVLADLSPVRP